MLRVVDITSGENDRWGAASEGWHLLDRAEPSVIQGRVPAPHSHADRAEAE